LHEASGLLNEHFELIELRILGTSRLAFGREVSSIDILGGSGGTLMSWSYRSILVIQYYKEPMEGRRGRI
jgi:hypothetical protein